MMQHVQYEPAHWTGRLRRRHAVFQTPAVLCSALSLRGSLIWAEAFLLLRQYVERERVKMMSGGRRLALIINHLVLLASC